GQGEGETATSAAEPMVGAEPSPGNGHLTPPPERASVPVEAGAGLGPAPAPVPSPATALVDVNASPLARSMARQAGLDLSALRGSGPRGRIVKVDVLAALAPERAIGSRRGSEAQAGPLSATPAIEFPPDGTPYDEVPHSRMRQVIARRLGESKRTIPHFYLAVHCRVDPLLRLREELQATDPGERKFSINDFAIRAAAVALRRVPEANASWTDGATRRYRQVDLAVAVATEEGLIAPVIRAADRKGLSELAAEVRDLAARARAGRLRPEEYQGGTFTVSNLGMY